MNIFALSLKVKKCALYHCDKHIVKMILESAQMLCTVLWLTGVEAPYKPAHKKHPCTLWAKESLSNWRWLRDLTEALNEEFKYRYNRDENHKSWDVVASLQEPNIPDLGLTKFALAMPEEYKCEDPVLSYRNYYVGAKHRFATWKKRPVPEWYTRMRKELENKSEGVVTRSKAIKRKASEPQTATKKVKRN